MVSLVFTILWHLRSQVINSALQSRYCLREAPPQLGQIIGLTNVIVALSTKAVWLFNWIPIKPIYDTRLFYCGEPRTDRDLGAARPKNACSLRHSPHWGASVAKPWTLFCQVGIAWGEGPLEPNNSSIDQSDCWPVYQSSLPRKQPKFVSYLQRLFY